MPELPDHFFWDPVNRELWHLLRTADPVQRAEIMVSPDADRIRSAIPTTLDRRGQAKALSDLVRRLWERQLKRDELEAAEAVASVAEDDGEEADALRAMTDDMKNQFTARLEQLRAVQTGNWNRDNRNA